MLVVVLVVAVLLIVYCVVRRKRSELILTHHRTVHITMKIFPSVGSSQIASYTASKGEPIQQNKANGIEESPVTEENEAYQELPESGPEIIQTSQNPAYDEVIIPTSENPAYGTSDQDCIRGLKTRVAEMERAMYVCSTCKQPNSYDTSSSLYYYASVSANTEGDVVYDYIQ